MGLPYFRRGFEYADCIPLKNVWCETAIDGEAPGQEIWEVWSTPSLPLRLGLHWPGAAVTFRIQPMA